MASLNETYDELAGLNDSKTNDDTFIIMPENENPNRKMVPEDDIFQFHRINPKKPESINGRNYEGFLPQYIKMAAANDILVFSTAEDNVFRLNLKTKVINEIEIPRKSASVHNIFIDQNANHFIISIENGTNYYYNMSKNKLIQLKFQLKIDSIAWNRKGDSINTDKILLASMNSLHELLISNLKEVSSKKILTLDISCTISSIYFEYINDDVILLFISTRNPCRFYHLYGDNDFTSFNNYFIGTDAVKYIEFDNSILNKSSFQLQFYPYNSQTKPSEFSVLTPKGIYSGHINYTSPYDKSSILYELILSEIPMKDFTPISHLMTEYFFLISDFNTVYIQNKLTGKISNKFQMQIDFDGQIFGLFPNYNVGDYYLFCHRTLKQITIHNEDRNVWLFYLSRAELGNKTYFDMALSKARTQEQQFLILESQADYHFHKFEYKEAADVYSRIPSVFEHIVLKFMSIKQYDCLREYIANRIKSYGNIPENKVKISLLLSWLVELFLSKLDSFSEENDEYIDIQFQYRTVLEEYKDYFNPKLIYNLISSHNTETEYIHFAELLEDTETAILYYIQKKQYDDAIHCLKITSFTDKLRDLIYKYSSILFINSPEKTSKLWIKLNKIDPEKIISCVSNHMTNDLKKYMIQYLSNCIYNLGLRSSYLHNYLLSLLASENDSTPLIQLLNHQPAQPIIDLPNSLRICNNFAKKKACAIIYGMLGLYEEAFKLSLSLDVNDAIHYINEIQNDKELRKKLWIELISHVSQENSDLSMVFSLLEQSEVTIEDILPHLPDFVVIDKFKDKICESLSKYIDEINDLKSKMDQYNEESSKITSDISNLKHRYGCIKSDHHCNLCNKLLLQEKFFLYPCTHAFHYRCLNHKLKLYYPSTNVETIRDLEDNFQQNEIDEILSSECIFCGHTMLNMLGIPLATQDDSQDWDLN